MTNANARIHSFQKDIAKSQRPTSDDGKKTSAAEAKKALSSLKNTKRESAVVTDALVGKDAITGQGRKSLRAFVERSKTEAATQGLVLQKVLKSPSLNAILKSVTKAAKHNDQDYVHAAGGKYGDLKALQAGEGLPALLLSSGMLSKSTEPRFDSTFSVKESTTDAGRAGALVKKTFATMAEAVGRNEHMSEWGTAVHTMIETTEKELLASLGKGGTATLFKSKVVAIWNDPVDNYDDANGMAVVITDPKTKEFVVATCYCQID